MTMTIVKSAITTLLLTVAVALPTAARTVRDFFAAEQNGIFMSLTHDDRLDMLDYYEAGQNMPITNNFGGTTSIDTLSANYMKLRTSASSHVELLMATSKRDTVLYVVQTVLLPAADSHVVAYDTEWNELNTSKHFKMPSLDDFIVIPKGDKTHKKADLATMVKMPSMECNIDPATGRMTITPTVQGTMTREDYDILRPYLTDSITFELKGTKYRAIDN